MNQTYQKFNNSLLDSATSILNDIRSDFNKNEFEKLPTVVYELNETVDNVIDELNARIVELNERRIFLEEQFLCNEQEHKKDKKANAELAEEIDIFKKDLSKLEITLDSKIKEAEDIKKKGEPSQKDKQILEKAKQKLMVFKEVTRITFDYKTPEAVFLQGYIKSFNNSGVKVFKYKGDPNPEKTSEKLWNELMNLEENNKENNNQNQN